MPSPFVAVTYFSPVASFTTMISAPGIDFASGSSTIPRIDPFGDCANTQLPERRSNSNRAAKVTRTKFSYHCERCADLSGFPSNPALPYHANSEKNGRTPVANSWPVAYFLTFCSSGFFFFRPEFRTLRFVSVAYGPQLIPVCLWMIRGHFEVGKEQRLAGRPFTSAPRLNSYEHGVDLIERFLVVEF